MDDCGLLLYLRQSIPQIGSLTRIPLTNVDRVRCFCPDTNYYTLSVNPHGPGARSHVTTLQRTCIHYWGNYCKLSTHRPNLRNTFGTYNEAT